MSINLQNLVNEKTKGITTSGYSDLISAGAIDILEKIKTYKQEDLQKFITEINVVNEDEEIWSRYNATGLYAWEIMSVKRCIDTFVLVPDNPSNKWKTATRLNEMDKDNYLNPNSLKFVSESYPGYTVESYTNIGSLDGDNDELANYSDDYNYVVTIFPQVSYGLYHSWKIQYIAIPENVGQYSVSENFHSSYIPALAVYIAKNIVMGEMQRLLLHEEDLELASELKNHYALLEQEYASLMNIPPRQEAQ